MYQNFPYILVFGSAIAFLRGVIDVSPRDIDVAFSGSFSEHDAQLAVDSWAKKSGLEGLPLDRHRFGSEVTLSGNPIVRIPVPEEAPFFFEILRGEVKVQRYDVTNLPALLRLSEWDVKKAAEKIMEAAGTEGHVSMPIIGLTPLALDRVDGYSGNGPEALANALHHADPLLFDELGEFGQLLQKIRNLEKRWPKAILPEAEREAEKASAGGFGRYYFKRFSGGWGAFLMYGDFYEIPPISIPKVWVKMTGLPW